MRVGASCDVSWFFHTCLRGTALPLLAEKHATRGLSLARTSALGLRHSHLPRHHSTARGPPTGPRQDRISDRDRDLRLVPGGGGGGGGYRQSRTKSTDTRGERGREKQYGYKQGAGHRSLHSVKGLARHIPSEGNSQRYLMYKAIHRNDPNGVWLGFNGILNNKEWHKVIEYDIIRVLQILNKQYAYEPSPEILNRLKSVVEVTERHGMRLKSIWAYNELIRLHLAEGRRDLAYWIKQNIESDTYGPHVKINVHTYAALFSDPFVDSLPDLIRLTNLYDEMLNRGITPNTPIQKSLITAARRIGEYHLLAALLESTSLDSVSHSHSTLAARFAGARGQAYIKLRKLSPALVEIQQLLSYQVIKDNRPIPEHHSEDGPQGEIKIPLELSDTRQAFFTYLRSTYESLIRTHLIRRKGKFAFKLLDDLRRNCYLPPTLMVYTCFVRYYSKRKDIQRLRELYDFMLQDGVAPNEHIYTKLITACMFTPGDRLLSVLAKKVAEKHPSLLSTSEADPAIDDPPKKGSGLPAIPRVVMATEDINSLSYFPKECVAFYEDMFLDHGAKLSDTRNRKLSPNIQIINAVMRSYMALEKPLLVLREFNRYCSNQRHLYSSTTPPDASSKQRHTLSLVFKMALQAAAMLGDRKSSQRIYNDMLEWGLQPPSSR
ncbi:hypothetical protein IWW37_003716 [Coemansia sp. RSA 2050]|nr:hypothetical protein IWW37_003716 [Coemansia sp. RSA 2050]KAJ2736683.1 hypothetical protein IW152_000652 [Coemansia sp. BCRC 34962]